MAFARRTMRCSSSPSLTIFIRSARSVGLRKLRFVFTRRVESIPLIRSNDFRKGAESRYIEIVTGLRPGRPNRESVRNPLVARGFLAREDDAVDDRSAQIAAVPDGLVNGLASSRRG